MNPLLVLCFAPVLATGAPPAAPAPEPEYLLYQPAAKLDWVLRGPPVQYIPQPGDIVLAAAKNLLSHIGHLAAGTGYPNHSAIVFARHDGSLAVLEAGPHGRLRDGMAISDMLPELISYAGEGRLYIRRRKVPLTPEESARLTEFAYAAEGRRFAIVRIYLQPTPLRSRMPLRAAFVGKPDPDKQSYFCSELVLNACCYAGLLDPEITRPAATYPRDLFFNESRNYFVNRGVKPMACGWDPPARWIPCGTSCQGTETAPVQLADPPHTVAKPAPVELTPAPPPAPRKNPSPYSPR